MNQEYPRFGLMTLILAVAMGLASAAVAGNSVKILQVDVDASGGTLTILGTGFDTPSDTTVELGAFGALTILSESTTEIVAALPSDVEPGNYLLSVTVRKGSSQTDEFDLSITARPKMHVIGFNGELGSVMVTQSPDAEPMPGMAITFDIPPGEDRKVLITFSAVSSCTQIPLDTDPRPYCLVIPNVSNIPANSYSIAAEEYGVQSANSFQWIAGPFSPGTHTVQMEWAASNPGFGAAVTFLILQATMSILTFPISDTTEDFNYIP